VVLALGVRNGAQAANAPVSEEASVKSHFNSEDDLFQKADR